jgi:hypothetical protein
MFAQISEKIQLTFWDLFIAFLSRASWLKWPIGIALRVRSDKQLKTKVATVVAISCTGLGMGMLLYCLALIL